jgi:transposase
MRSVALAWITKTGNAHLRRGRIEAAWHYRHHPFVGDTRRARQRGAPAAIIAQAWTAQQRLHRRYARFAARGRLRLGRLDPLH